MNATVNVEVSTTFEFELEDVESEKEARAEVDRMLVAYLGAAYTSNGFETAWKVTLS